MVNSQQHTPGEQYHWLIDLLVQTMNSKGASLFDFTTLIFCQIDFPDFCGQMALECKAMRSDRTEPIFRSKPSLTNRTKPNRSQY